MSVVLVSLLVVGFLLISGFTHGRGKGDTSNVSHFSYVDGPDSFSALVNAAEEVVVARPAGPEVVVASFEGGLEIAGQPFTVVTSIRGPVQSGAQITVLRTTLSSDSSTGERPFDLPVYVLGLRQSATYPGWITLGGPSGRIGFGSNGTVVVEEPDIAVQQEVAGKSLAEVIALAQSA